MFDFFAIFKSLKTSVFNEKIKFSLAFLLIFFSFQVFSSNFKNNNNLIEKLIDKADSNYRNYNFNRSISYLEVLYKNQKQLSSEQKKYVLLSLAQSYYYTGDYDKSIVLFNEIIKKFNYKNQGFNEYYYNCLINLGMAYSRTSNFELSLLNFNKAENLIINSLYNTNERKATVFYNKALIYYETGDYEKSLLYNERTLRLYEQNKSESGINIARIYNNIANNYLKKKDFQQAKIYYQKSIIIKEKISPKDLANSYNAYAVAFKLSGEMSNAEKYYKKAIENRLKFNSQNPDLAKDYLNYADFCLAINKNQKALDYYKKSYQLFEKYYGFKNSNTSATLVALGDFYFRNHKISTALSYYQDALIAVSESFNIKDLNYNPLLTDATSNLYLLKALKGKALSLNQLCESDVAKLDLSFRTYQLAIRVIDELGKKYLSDESKMFLNDNEKLTYVAAMEVAQRLFKLTNNADYINLAFTYAEKSKSSVLLSNIRSNEALAYGKIPSFIQNIEQTLKKKITQFEQNLYVENSNDLKNADKISDLKNKIFDLKQNQEKFYQYLDKNYKSYYNLKIKNEVSDVASLQRKLKEKEAIVEYVLIDNKLLSFLITKDYFTLHSEKIDNQFYKNIETVRSFSSTNTFGNSSLEVLNKYTSASYKLYEILLKPFEKQILCNHLIIIPDKELNLISFETLLNRQVICNNFNYSTLPYIINENPISYSYSASLIFKRTNEKIQSESARLLAIAPGYSNQSAENNQMAANYQRNKISPLPFAKDEINGISKIFKGQVLENYNANKNNFFNKINDYDILHLAMHAEMNDKDPMYSKLIFSESSFGKEDGVMNTSDIYNMNIHSRLVVLSACNTGDGQLRNGEGVMSLARAFFYAGCPSVVMTLWSVEDRASSELMVSFYKYLSKGFEKDKALQLAKIDYIQNSPSSKTHPYFWGAYVPIGDQSPVNQSHEDHTSLAFFALIAGVGLGITPFFTNRKLRRKTNQVFRLRSRVFNS